MFSPAFRLALERTLQDDITPEALETVFRASMRKITDAKKCRTGINLSKNLLIAKIMHKTRNIIITAKKDQEATATSPTIPASPVANVANLPCGPTSPRPSIEKAPLVEARSEPSSRASSPLPAPLRLRQSQSESEMPAVDENVAPASSEGTSPRLCSNSRPLKHSHSWCSSGHSTYWNDSPPSKVARMEIDDDSETVHSNCCSNPSISTSVAAPTAHVSVTSSSNSGHLPFHNQQHHLHPPSPPPAAAAAALWTFCAKEQPSASPVAPIIYSPYHQRIPLPLTTCPI